MPDLSLAHLTVLSLAPPAMIEIAARTGYQAVGLRLIAATPTSAFYPLMDDPAALRATTARLADTGIRVGDIEFVKITSDLDVGALEPFLATGAALGARHVIAAPYDPDLSRLADTFAALSDNALRYGLTVLLEFFPWTVVPNLAGAARILDRADRTNTGILLDTLHFDRSDSTLADIDSITPARFPFVHLADALRQSTYSLEDLLHTARAERLAPGTGQIDLAAILRRLPRDATIGLEVPMEAMSRARGHAATAAHVRTAALRLLAGL